MTLFEYNFVNIYRYEYYNFARLSLDGIAAHALFVRGSERSIPPPRRPSNGINDFRVIVNYDLPWL